jgi:hypothetical protein
MLVELWTVLPRLLLLCGHILFALLIVGCTRRTHIHVVKLLCVSGEKAYSDRPYKS